jgi:tetratricopeptide (TPR) repeat protein
MNKDKSGNVSTRKTSGKVTREARSVGIKARAQKGKRDSAPGESAEALLVRAKTLAWAGQHEKALDLYSRALEVSALKPELQMDLLDMRAESYIAQGKLDLAAQDADAMHKLAEARKTGSESLYQKLKAQTLNRLTLVQMRRGELKQALDSAVSALKLSEQTKQKSLIAMSLLRLSEARQRTGRSQESIETAQQAIPLFRELGDTTGEGRAVWAASTPYYRLGRVQDSRRASQTSLDLARAAGD